MEIRIKERFRPPLLPPHPAKAPGRHDRTTSIKVDPEVWKEAKKLATDRDTTVGLIVERILRRESEMEPIESLSLPKKRSEATKKAWEMRKNTD